MVNFVNLLLISSVIACVNFRAHCLHDEFDYDEVSGVSTMKLGMAKRRRYLLYDVNPGEGFNLRRDVYLRIANFVRKLRRYDDWILVLPPWGHIYHWQSKDIGEQHRIPWGMFFDLPSLYLHVPVIELQTGFLKQIAEPVIDEVYYLQNYPNMFEDGDFKDKFEKTECSQRIPYHNDKHLIEGWFWGFEDLKAKQMICLFMQGQTSTLIPLILESNATSVMIDRAEIMLHDVFGDTEYWEARRSMRFEKHLVEVGNRFRQNNLNSTDLTDQTELKDDWRDFKPKRGTALGGPYVAVHLRRQDFLYGHAKHVPTIKHAVKQIKALLKRYKLEKVFIATDASQEEIDELERKLSTSMVRYVPSQEEKLKFKDGGVAIIDQWICAHSRYFIGTYESTFSFRIQEEREILGFHLNTTFNRLCGDDEKSCEQPTRWKIVQ